MEFVSKNNLNTPINLDGDETTGQDRILFAKGLNLTVEDNPGVNAAEGLNFGRRIPEPGNLIATPGLVMPAGVNSCCGTYKSKHTNRLFVFVYNTLGNHFIYLINGRDASSQKVYTLGEYLDFQFGPEFYFGKGRVTSHVLSFVENDVVVEKEFIGFTNNHSDPKVICVEDSIATNSFTGAFFAKPGDYHAKDYIKLGVPTPMGNIEVERVENLPADNLKQNLMLFTGWQFRLMFVDVWNRPSEYGFISDTYLTITGGKCSTASNSLNRCVNLKFDAGSPTIKQIHLVYRKWTNGNPADWVRHDVIEKYDNSNPAQKWYQKAINPALTYNAGTNILTYKFCADKDCTPLPASETTRLQNPIPLTASSIFPLNKGFGLANLKRGFDKINPAELNYVDFSVSTPAGGSCNPQTRRIVIYLKIFNMFNREGSYLRKVNGTGKTVFGLGDGKYTPHDYQLVFPDNQDGFIVYLAGTEFKVVTEQVFHLPGAHYTTDEIVGPWPTESNKMFLFQRAVIDVPPGKYVARVSSHTTPISDGNYERTSTYVACQSTLQLAGTFNHSISSEKELIIDVCAGDHLSGTADSKCLMIWDLTEKDAKNVPTILDGYLLEDEVGRQPIEAAIVTKWSSSNGLFGMDYTDHNGFYFLASEAARLSIEVSYNDCTGVTVRKVEGNDDRRVWHKDMSIYQSGNKYPEAGRWHVKGRIVDCDNADFGISGVLVIMNNGRYAFTDSDGRYDIVAHNRPGGYLPAKIIISQRGSCQIVSCVGDCNYCINILNANQPACGGGRDVNMDNVAVKMNGINKYGPQNAGRYGLGLVAVDTIGRKTYVQALDKHFVDIPSLVEKQRFQHSVINFAINGAMRFPVRFDHFYFCITKNQNFDEFLSWPVDKVEFVDAAGNINNGAPTQINLYIESLTAYNNKANFNTNTNWQFLYNTGTDAGRITDRIQFIAKPDGTFFDKTIISLVKYDKAGKYVTIEYNTDLKDLQAGTLIQLMRPRSCSGNEIYYSVGPSIKVVNGIPQTLNGTLNYFDSYFLNRDIPVPGANNSINVKTYPYSYEHDSPADTWGAKCCNRGEPNTKNPYERQIVEGSSVINSKVAISSSNFNGLGYFDEADIKTFDEQAWGHIVAVIVRVNTVLIICENANFIVGFNDANVMVGEDGNVLAGSAQGRWGSPQKVPANPQDPKDKGSGFGCQFQDINTIQIVESSVIFLDRHSKALVKHSFSQTEDMASQGYSSYLDRKIAAVNKFATAGAICYFVSGYDPKKGEYFLGSFQKATVGSGFQQSFINNDGAIDYSKNETISIDIASGALKEWKAFTAEYYGDLEGYISDKNLYSFRNGVAWSHRDIPGQAVAPFNNFYGTQTKKYMEILVNAGPEKIKHFLFNEVYCKEHMFVSERVVTEPGQLSRLRSGVWERKDTFWSASFKCATNTPPDPNRPQIPGGFILDGDPLYGCWLIVRYQTLDADDNKYCELRSVAVYGVTAGQSAD